MIQRYYTFNLCCLQVSAFAFVQQFSLILDFLCFPWMQKGTVVEKLVEETASDDKHLRQLISICEGNH